MGNDVRSLSNESDNSKAVKVAEKVVHGLHINKLMNEFELARLQTLKDFENMRLQTKNEFNSARLEFDRKVREMEATATEHESKQKQAVDEKLASIPSEFTVKE